MAKWLSWGAEIRFTLELMFRKVDVRAAGAMALAASFLVGVLAIARAEDGIPFPSAYRRWAHVKSAIVGPQSPLFATEAGIHHVYANEPALLGFRNGAFPEGSILVYDLLETKDVDGMSIEWARRRVDVMVKQSGRFGDTGGWGFATFAGGSGTAAPHRPACFECHAKRKDRDFVFSELRP